MAKTKNNKTVRFSTRMDLGKSVRAEMADLLNARLALFSRDQWTFRNELKVSQELLAANFDANDKSVQTAQSTLRQMTATDINVELPTLKDSQAALRGLRQGKEKR